MAAVARLTWQSADPARLASSLERRIGAAAVPDRDGFALPLGVATLELVPWRAEDAGDAPTEGGRLVFEPAWEAAELSPVLSGADDDPRLLGVAWATVELGRAEAELEMWLSSEGHDPGECADPHLGATVRVRRTHDLPVGRLAIAEPFTEGRVAASLARDGEGPCALYLATAAGLEPWLASARARGVAVARRETGPFGPQVLVLGGPVAGPHILLVDPISSSSAGPSPGTINA